MNLPMLEENSPLYPHAFVYQESDTAVFRVRTGGKGTYGAYTAEELRTKIPLEILARLVFLTREQIQGLYEESNLIRPLSPEEQAVMLS